jgi:glycine betaine catabolism B
MKFKFIDKKSEANNTTTFLFEPSDKLDFLPGQFVYITLPKLDQSDERGPTRHFTISSSPTEGKMIAITTRVRDRSGYKNTLDNLKRGDQVEAEGPDGTFILDDNTAGSHVFIAGGIGITPFRSMLKYSFDKNLQNDFRLIYSNSTLKDTAFIKEIESWQTHKNFKLDLVITKPEKNDKRKGLTGRIDKQMLQKLLNEKTLTNSTFWVSGPPEMVSSMESHLAALKIPAKNVRSEKFTGY